MDIRFISAFSTGAVLTWLIRRMSDQVLLCPCLDNTFAEFLLCTDSETTPGSFVTFWTPCARLWLTNLSNHIHIYTVYIFFLKYSDVVDSF